MNPQNNDNSQIPDYLRTSSTTPRAQTYQSAVVPSATDIPAIPDIFDHNAAADLVRQKLAAIYSGEPDAQQEAAKVAAIHTPLSPHQHYMQNLQSSGKSWAEVQNAWHEYYAHLPDVEKHQVWQEFYSTSRTGTPFQQQMYERDQAQAAQATQAAQSSRPQPAVIPADFTPAPIPQADTTKPRPSVADIKKRIIHTVGNGGTLKKTDHLKSLGFGLATGALVVFIFLFGFFNEMFISPLIQPSRKASETPIIVDTASAIVGAEPKVIIPKINVEIPVDYTQTSTDEKAIEAALDKGIVHYPTTVRPGQAGNAAFFGHSSNNIFNPGKYKFAFVLLHKLVEGDTFYLTSDGKSYAYQVISRRVVEPTEVSVLGSVANETATATLITCDPPGTSLHRLVVVGRQISPDPASNAAPVTPGPILADTAQSNNLPGNGPTLWSRVWHSVF